tara:strand:+ start:482 stop:1369 length:888 start_codon:yes stop_codon:yes gene_type:complete
MALPNLLIVGAAKSGTTSLHNYLNQHPDIFMCSPKEPHFLINKEIGEQRIPNGVHSLEDYKSLFLGESERKYRGESSVMYLSFPEFVISNIKQYLSDDVKIIIMLRDPVDRAYSGYQHVKRYNVMESLSFEDALKQSEGRYHNTSNMTPASKYLELGMYYKQVKMFFEAFNNVHLIIYDDYNHSFKEEINKVFHFLDLEPIKINTQEEYMLGGWEWKSEWMKSLMIKNNPLKRILKFLFPIKSLRKIIRKIIQKGNIKKVEKIKPETEKWLKEYYKSDVKELSLLLGRNLNHWTL